VRRRSRIALATLLLVLGLLGLPAVAASAAPAPPPGDRPNIVLITSDDQSFSDLQYMPFTRRLLGGEGVSFTDALSTYPLCCPARATLVTGQHAHNHGVLANTPPAGGWEALRDRADTLLPVWLQRAGYRTTFTGKFLNTYGHGDGRTEVPPGWDDWNASVRGVYDYHRVEVNENGRVVSHAGEYQADVVQDVTEDAVREAARTGQPMFLWQSNLAPHGACTYGDSDRCTWEPPVPAEEDVGSLEGAPFGPGSAASFNERVVVEKPTRVQELPHRDEEQVRRLADKHQARIESLQAVDRNVRDTVQLLRAEGMLDSTLLVFASDNGYALGEHRWQGKRHPYEPMLKVPLLMRGPGVPAGKKVEETVGLVDIPATIAEVAGADPLIVQDGVSLRDVAAGRERGYEAISIEAGPAFDDVPTDSYAYRGVRTRRYTYLEHPSTGEVELYDRKEDPDQLVNVAHRPTHAATRRALERKLRLLQDCAGRACHAVAGDVPAPEPPRGEVHPDELALSARTKQLVTLTAARPGAVEAEAIAWQREGRRWVPVRGPMTVGLGGQGLGPSNGRRRGTVATGVHEPRAGFGTAPETDGSLVYRQLADADLTLGPRPRHTHDVLRFLSSSAATWRPEIGRVMSESPHRFERSLVMGPARPGGSYWSPRLSEWIDGVPGNVRRGTLLLHTGARLDDQGWVAMEREDLTFLLDWAEPEEANTTLAVGTPEDLKSRY
jgi:N-acetylglucosamine-6-sulfatase